MRPQSTWGNDQCFTNTLWALSNWDHRPPDAWLAECCRLATPFIQGMSLKSLLIVATALADLNHKPPLEWTGRLLECVHVQHALTTTPAAPAACTAAPVAGTAAAAGNVGAVPSGAMDPEHTANLIWAVSRMLRAPPSSALPDGSRSKGQAPDATDGAGASAAWLRKYQPLLKVRLCMC